MSSMNRRKISTWNMWSAVLYLVVLNRCGHWGVNVSIDARWVEFTIIRWFPLVFLLQLLWKKPWGTVHHESVNGDVICTVSVIRLVDILNPCFSHCPYCKIATEVFKYFLEYFKTFHHHHHHHHRENGCRPQWPLYPRHKCTVRLYQIHTKL